MQDFMVKAELVNQLFEDCPILKDNTYVASAHDNYVIIQAHYNYEIVQELISKYEFDFKVSNTGFVEAVKRFYGFNFNIEITLT